VKSIQEKTVREEDCLHWRGEGKRGPWELKGVGSHARLPVQGCPLRTWKLKGVGSHARLPLQGCPLRTWKLKGSGQPWMLLEEQCSMGVWQCTLARLLLLLPCLCVFYASCALRRIKLPIAADDVRREVKILKLLTNHPNVVQFIDAFEDNEARLHCHGVRTSDLCPFSATEVVILLLGGALLGS